MEEIYHRIAEYQKAMGYDFENMPYEQRLEMFRNYMVALQIEQAELALEVPWKPWRPIEDQHVGAFEIQAEEWVDCMFFLFDQAFVLGLTKEKLREAFELKMEKNMERIKSGYNKIQGDD